MAESNAGYEPMHVSDVTAETKTQAFDRLIDMALEGQITQEEALAAFKREYPETTL